MSLTIHNTVCKEVAHDGLIFSAAAVTPSDSTDLANTARAVHVAGSSGLVYVTLAGMTTGTSVGVFVTQGSMFKGYVTRIWNTGTTATSIVACY